MMSFRWILISSQNTKSCRQGGMLMALHEHATRT